MEIVSIVVTATKNMMSLGLSVPNGYPKGTVDFLFLDYNNFICSLVKNSLPLTASPLLPISYEISLS